MQRSTLLVALLAFALLGAVGFGAARAFSGGSNADNDQLLIGEIWSFGKPTEEPPVFVPDMVEKSTTIIYPYTRTDLSGNLHGAETGDYGISPDRNDQPTFAESDHTLIDAAAELPCPEGADEQRFDELSLVLCVPDGWEPEMFTISIPGIPEHTVDLMKEPAVELYVPGSAQGLVFVGLMLSEYATVDGDVERCSEPGLFDLETAVVEVCFFPSDSGNEQGVEGFTRRMLVFVTPKDQGEELWGSLMSARMFSDEPLSLDDQAFREALAILANLRFD